MESDIKTGTHKKKAAGQLHFSKEKDCGGDKNSNRHPKPSYLI